MAEGGPSGPVTPVPLLCCRGNYSVVIIFVYTNVIRRSELKAHLSVERDEHY